MVGDLRQSTEIVRKMGFEMHQSSEYHFLGVFLVKLLPVFGWFRSVVSANIVKNGVELRQSAEIIK